VLCAHAALSLAAAFNTSPADLNVYWEMVSAEQGGIYGRRVDVTYENDNYEPARAVEAAEACKAKRPFLILGGIGFDQIPAVRSWADTNRMLYLHHIAVGAGGENKQYSFTAQPTVEQVGVAFAEYLAATHAGKRLGVVYRDSENWEPGRRAGVAELRRRGTELVADLPVQKNASIYSSQILELKRKDVQVVWVWENALAAAELIQQAHAQAYRPVFVVFPFQTILDVVGPSSLEPPIEGVATWPAYTRGGYGGQWDEYGLGQAIREFEAAMRRYRPNADPNDILFQVWLGNHAFHQLLLACGPDCTRNTFAGIFLSGLKGRLDPNCAADFSIDGHRGGRQFLVHRAANGRDGPEFRTVRWCSDHLD
jgi:branched-chain amino acid transport system substrate-binding protein